MMTQNRKQPDDNNNDDGHGNDNDGDSDDDDDDDDGDDDGDDDSDDDDEQDVAHRLLRLPLEHTHCHQRQMIRPFHISRIWSIFGTEQIFLGFVVLHRKSKASAMVHLWCVCNILFINVITIIITIIVIVITILRFC